MGQITKMAAEVNKLIGSRLLSGEAVLLPEVGSLCITMSTSQRKRVEFSSEPQGVSLVDVIKERANCSDEEALKIYNMWVEEVRVDSTLVVEGVGELKANGFVTVDSFAKQLNPIVEQKEEELAVVAPVVVPTPAPKREVKQNSYNRMNQDQPKRSNKGIIVAIVAILLIIGGFFLISNINNSRAEKARIEAEASAKAKEAQRVADSIKIANLEAERLAAEAEVESEKPLRFRWVYGVFSEQGNVDRAVRDINRTFGEGRAKCYPYGACTLVSMFESDDRAECQRLLMNNYDTYPDSWIYELK